MEAAILAKASFLVSEGALIAFCINSCKNAGKLGTGNCTYVVLLDSDNYTSKRIYLLLYGSCQRLQ
jgi:hypothetical protein